MKQPRQPNVRRAARPEIEFLGPSNALVNFLPLLLKFLRAPLSTFIAISLNSKPRKIYVFATWLILMCFVWCMGLSACPGSPFLTRAEPILGSATRFGRVSGTRQYSVLGRQKPAETEY